MPSDSHTDAHDPHELQECHSESHELRECERDSPTPRQDASAGGRPLPAIDSSWAAWRFLAGCTLLEALVFGFGTAYGAFQDYHIKTVDSPLHNSSTAVIATPGTLFTFGNFFAPFLFQGVLRIFPNRVILIASAALVAAAASLIIASVSSSPAVIVVFQGLFLGWLAGVAWTPSLLWLPQWFDRHRGLATGVMFLGSGIGGAGWAFALSALLSSVGFAWTLRAVALIFLVIGGIGLAMTKPRLPAQGLPRLGLLPTLAAMHDRAAHSALGIVNGLILLIQGAAFWSVLYYLPTYATSLGFSSTASTGLLALANAFTGFSFVIFGRLGDRFQAFFLALGSGIGGALLAGAFLGFVNSAAPLMVFSVLFGLASGGVSALISPMSKQIGKKVPANPAAVALEYLAWRGVGSIAGPLISSALYQKAITSTMWGAGASFGPHGMGPVILLSTVCSGVVALLATSALAYQYFERAG